VGATDGHAKINAEVPGPPPNACSLRAPADRDAQGRVASLLEGGYDLVALAERAAAHVETLMA
jgi:hypothetical protein